MALPVDSRQANNLMTSTIDAWLPDLVDNFFLSNPLFIRLRTRDNIKRDGGAFIRANMIYGPVPAGAHQTGTPYNTDITQFMTYALLNWVENYGALAMDEHDQAKNRGAAEVIDYALALQEVAEMSLAQTVGQQLYSNGTAPTSIDGLLTAIQPTGATTYGGIARDGSAQGKAVTQPNVNAVGGPFSWDLLQDAFGGATIGREKPDLILTSQKIWNRILTRIIPQQRFASEDLKAVGMDAINYNGADIVVDQQIPEGYIFVLNSKWLKFVTLEGYDFVRRSSLYDLPKFPIANDSKWVDQVVMYANLVVQSPRLQNWISNVDPTATPPGNGA